MTRSRQGFTLVELLIVVAIIGILAAIALPKFSSAKEQAYIGAMTSDLKSLATHQEIYYSRQQAYSSATGDLSGYQPSKNVNIAMGRVADASGGANQAWTAKATHALAATNIGCAIYNGNLASGGTTPGGLTATIAGTVVCD